MSAIYGLLAILAFFGLAAWLAYRHGKKNAALEAVEADHQAVAESAKVIKAVDALPIDDVRKRLRDQGNG